MGAKTSAPTTTPVDCKPLLNKLIVLTRTGDAEEFVDRVEGYLQGHEGNVDTVVENLKNQFDFDIAKDVCRHGNYELYKYLRTHSKVDFNFGTSAEKVR